MLLAAIDVLRDNRLRSLRLRGEDEHVLQPTELMIPVAEDKPRSRSERMGAKLTLNETRVDTD